MTARSKATVLIIASLGDPPYVGGIENVVNTLLHSELSEAFNFSVFDTYRAPNPSRTRLAKALYAVGLPHSCWTRLQETRPNIVHIHFCSRVDFWKHAICLAVSSSYGTKTIFHLHGGSFDAFFEEVKPIQRSLIKKILSLADCVVALSSYWKDFLAELVPVEKIRILNNPIDCDRLAPSARSPDAENPIVLLLGSLGKRKGHYDVLKALPIVVKAHPDVKVLFGGSDEDQGATEQLKSLAAAAGFSRNVEFLGPVGFNAKVELLRTSTIAILPSYGENMPISVLEAMAARMPVISTRVGAIPEVLDQGEAGLLIDPGDWKALGLNINRLLDDPKLAARLGKVAGERAKDQWDVKRIARRVEFVYRKVRAE